MLTDPDVVWKSYPEILIDSFQKLVDTNSGFSFRFAVFIYLVVLSEYTFKAK